MLYFPDPSRGVFGEECVTVFTGVMEVGRGVGGMRGNETRRRSSSGKVRQREWGASVTGFGIGLVDAPASQLLGDALLTCGSAVGCEGRGLRVQCSAVECSVVPELLRWTESYGRD